MKKKKTKAQKRIAKILRNNVKEIDPILIEGHFRRLVRSLWVTIIDIFEDDRSEDIDLLQDVADICMLSWNIATIYPALEEALSYVNLRAANASADEDELFFELIRDTAAMKQWLFPGDRVTILQADVSFGDNAEPGVEIMLDGDFDPSEPDYSLLEDISDMEILKKALSEIQNSGIAKGLDKAMRCQAERESNSN